MNVTYNIPESHYIICIVAVLITAYAIIKQIYLVSIKRVPFYKTWGLFLTWFVFAVPSVMFYEEITQMEVFPKYVKTVKLDLSHSRFESDLIDDVIKVAKEHNAECSDNICTMDVLEFKHNSREVDIKISNESDGEMYCGVCASPIDYDFRIMRFIAYVYF